MGFSWRGIDCVHSRKYENAFLIRRCITERTCTRVNLCKDMKLMRNKHKSLLSLEMKSNASTKSAILGSSWMNTHAISITLPKLLRSACSNLEPYVTLEPLGYVHHQEMGPEKHLRLSFCKKIFFGEKYPPLKPLKIVILYPSSAQKNARLTNCQWQFWFFDHSSTRKAFFYN
jgi:hypothetical protein